MSAIETIRQRPKTIAVVVAVVVLAAVTYAALSLRPATPSIATDTPKVYFTTDNGTTWFPDDAAKMPPFSKDGKDAVRIHLYDAGEGKPPLVGHLERYSPQTLAQINALKGKPNTEYQIADLQASGIEVKRKADPKWTPGSTLEASKIRQPPTAPNGDPLPELGP